MSRRHTHAHMQLVRGSVLSIGRCGKAPSHRGTLRRQRGTYACRSRPRANPRPRTSNRWNKSAARRCSCCRMAISTSTPSSLEPTVWCTGRSRLALCVRPGPRLSPRNAMSVKLFTLGDAAPTATSGRYRRRVWWSKDMVWGGVLTKHTAHARAHTPRSSTCVLQRGSETTATPSATLSAASTEVQTLHGHGGHLAALGFSCVCVCVRRVQCSSQLHVAKFTSRGSSNARG